MLAVQRVDEPLQESPKMEAMEREPRKTEFEIKIEIWIDDKAFVADWRKLKPCGEFEKCGHFTFELHESLDELEGMLQDFVKDVMAEIRKIKEEKITEEV